MEEREREEVHDKYVPKFLYSTLSSLCSQQNTMTVSNSNLYTSNESIDGSLVCDGESCLSRSESTAIATEETKDKSEKLEKLKEDDQDIYVPRFYIPPILTFYTDHAVDKDVEDATIESVNEAQACVDESFLSTSESPDSESKVMGDIEIEKSDASGKWTALCEKTCDTIRVRLNIPLTKDTLKSYFENTQKSGGGYIVSLTTIKGTDSKVEDALITFAESKYATNCLQQDHMLYKMSLDVQKLDRQDPTLWEMNKALVTGLNPITTQETLVEFLEPPAGVELISLVKGKQEDAAILVFAEKPDFAKMCNQCKETTLDGKTLFVQMVMKCQSIYVKGIDKSITCNLIENFFCNKRKSGGGGVEKVDYHPEDGYCIVYFENPSDARNVAAQEKFTIDKREVQAEMYYPCLGLSEKPTNWEDMPCVSYESNVYVINFVQNCLPAYSQINEALQKKFVKIKWPKSKSDSIVKLQCTMTKDMKTSKEILISWKEDATVEMDRHMKRFVYKLHSILPEAWSLFLTRLKTLNIGDPIKVNVVLEQENHTAILTGYEENTEALTRTILDFIKTEESKIRNRKRIMKNVPLDFHKCQKIWETHFWKKLKSDFPDLVFQVKNIKKEVNLTGKPAKVNEALIKIYEYLMITKSKSLNISKGRYKMFSMKEVKDRFIAEMKAKRNMAVWNVTDDKVYMTSSNLEMVDDALDTFKKFIPEEKN